MADQQPEALRLADALNNALVYGLRGRKPAKETPLSHADENWQALPQRLRGRGRFLIERGRIKDAELMFDAALEIEGLREKKKKV